VSRHGSPRKYPRTARVNEVVREAIADELERLSDPRLGLVTVTGVEVSPDLRHATVYYSALGATGRRGGGEPVLTTSDDTREATHAALRAAAPHLRASLGRQVRLKYVPELVFREDPAVAQGERVDQILRDLHSHEQPAAEDAE
jgi:ribosome-binding factor A